MSHSLLHDSRLYRVLWLIDRDLAEGVREGGCPFCGAKLHSARYPRKPRGFLDLGPEHRWRWSFCCASEGCRRRATPPSVRFLGRRIYLSTLVVLITAMQQGPSPRGWRSLREQFGVDRRTLGRWREWWCETFVESPFWKGTRSRFHPPVKVTEIPRSLLDRFTTREPIDRLVQFLKLIAPISTATGVPF